MSKLKGRIRPAPKPSPHKAQAPGGARNGRAPMSVRKALKLAVESLRGEVQRIAPEANMLRVFNIRTPTTEAAQAARETLAEAIRVLESVMPEE